MLRNASLISWAVGGTFIAAAAMLSCSSSDSGVPTAVAFSHGAIPLLDEAGQPLTADSQVPYSPRATCGGCHDIDKIANAYHFQQGRTDLAGNVVTRNDYFEDGREWLRSAGMYGKW